MDNAIQQLVDGLTGVGTAEAAITPDTYNYLRKVEGGVQKKKNGKVISNAGIEQPTYREFVKQHSGVGKPLENLSEPEIKAVYDWYFKDLPYEKLNPKTSMAVADSAFNFGPSYANKTLQELSGVKSDGKIGPKTISAANSTDDNLLAQGILSNRKQYETTRPNYLKNKKGWDNRTNTLKSTLNGVK